MLKRKRPTQETKSAATLAAIAGNSGLRKGAGGEVESGAALERGELVKRFADALAEDGTLDRSDQDLLIAEYTDALDLVIGQSLDLVPLDRVSIAETVELLGVQGDAGQADRGALIRKFDETLGSLDSLEKGKLRIAKAYLAKLSEEGPEAALDWLAKVSSIQDPVDTQNDGRQENLSTLSLPQSITRSKSRRLRGPPS